MREQKEHIAISSISLRCNKCKEWIYLKDMKLRGSSRQFDYSDGKAKVRCEECGNLHVIEFDLKYKVKVKGLSCGVCEKTSNKMHDSYFCLKCWIIHLEDDQKRYEEYVKENSKKLKDAKIGDSE